jgi:uncharacterized protein YuzE
MRISLDDEADAAYITFVEVSLTPLTTVPGSLVTDCY